jgi:ACS family sodium-dependent inorganic phosphate cotransporter
MGGFLADCFGGKIVLGLGILRWSFFTIVTPWAALFGMLGLLVARVCMGWERQSPFHILI